MINKYFGTLENKILILLFIIAVFLNTYNSHWDGGNYLHPDERLYITAFNIKLPNSIKEFLSPTSSLNPHMFYYGPLPLYLYKLFFNIISSTGNFLFTSRILSGIFASLTVILIFYIGKKAFNSKTGLLASLIFIFSPGIIQHAHFITTESILNFFLSLIILLCIVILIKKQGYLFLSVGIIVGFAAASKVIGVTFFFVPFITFIFLLFKTKNKKKLFFYFFGSLLIIIVTNIILAPYQIIDFKNFIYEQSYMQSLILGSNKAPFTIIYNNTLPYLYPLLSVLPLTFGFLSLPLGLIGFFALSKRIIMSLTKKSKLSTTYIVFILIILYPILYFSWAGGWYAKYSRYYILLIPFLSLTAAYVIHKLSRKIQLLIIIFIILNGLMFFKNIYFNKNPRIEASSWIYKNILKGKVISSEYWDDSLPLSLINDNPSQNYVPQQYSNLQLHVYDKPDNYQKINILAHQLYQSDYFIISSRRVYYSILKNKDEYPYTVKFYSLLFEGKIGYKLIKKFTNYPFVLPDDWADESFQSYDHPPVLIFVNEKKYLPEALIPLILFSK